MQVSVESVGNLERRMTITVPEELVTNEVDVRIKRLAQTVKVDGFRPGKVPMNEVLRRYGAAVREEVIGDLMQSTFYNAIKEEKLTPAGVPHFEAGNITTGKPVEYIATFEVYPEFKPANFAGVALEKVTAEVTEADLDDVLEKLRKQHTEWEPVERAATLDDQVNIDFEGSIDGVPFNGGTAQNVKIILGSKMMIPGFEDGLIGATPGSEVLVHVTFPEQYHAADLAGKAAEFKVKVNAVESPKLPELNEEFARRLGIDGGIAELRAELNSNMERDLTQVLKEMNKTALMNKVVELNTIDLPKALVEAESKQLQQQAIERMRKQMNTDKLPQIPLDLFNGEASRRVLLGLVLSALIKEFDVKVDEERVKALIMQIAAAYQQPEDVVNWYYKDKDQLNHIHSLVLEDQISEKLYEQAQVTEKMLSYSDAMNKQSAQG